MKKNLRSQRYHLRQSLWTNGHQQVFTLDSFDRVKVLSPSLAYCLLQRTTQDRTVDLNKYSKSDQVKAPSEALEKITYRPEFRMENKDKTCNYVQASQPYLRSSVIDHAIALLFVKYSTQPRLRSFTVYDDAESIVFNRKVFPKFGEQLQSLKYEGIHPFVMISSVDVMSRLMKLKINIIGLPSMVQPNIGRIIPWHQLSAFSLRCEYTRYIFECAQLWDQLGQMTQLCKLSIELSFHEYLDIDFYEDLNVEEIKQFLTEKFSTIPKFHKLEVLNFGVQVTRDQDPTLDYSNEFPHLETLVLNYPDNDSVFLKLYDHEDKRTPSKTIRHLIMANFFGNNFSCREIFAQIPTIFPNLVELNLKGTNSTLHSYGTLTDYDVMNMIERLPHLCTLRFMDNHPKLRRLLGSIELMCKRATELKPKVPMLFQVPLGKDFEVLKYFVDQLPDELKSTIYCWEKAAMWIQLC